MSGQQSRKGRGSGGERTQRAFAKPSEFVERKHQPGHERRPPQQTPMLLLVCVKIAALKCTGERDGLLKGEAEPFASDSIDGAGGITEECDATADHTLQAAGSGDRATFRTGRRAPLQASHEVGKIMQRLAEPEVAIAGYDSGADFIGTYWRDIE